MSWSEIKHAVNSTLGTDRFLPLDTILYTQKSVQASANVNDIFVDMLAGKGRVSEESPTILTPKIQILTSGTIKLCGATTAGQSQSVQCEFYKNDVQIAQYTTNNSSTYLSFTVDKNSYYYKDITPIVVNPGDIIYANYTLKASTGQYVYSLLLGTLTDNPVRFIERG